MNFTHSDASSPLQDTSTPTKMGYRPALDGLRTIAIGLVLAEHTGLELFDGGNSGVIVFFALSGFLITKLMLEEWSATATLDVKAFYGRRTVRIMPAPLVMVTLVFLLSWHIMPDAADRRYLWFELVLTALYIYSLRPILFGDGGLFGARLQADTETYMAHTWSLAIEEHFYLVWPWLLRGMKLPNRNPLLVIRWLVGFAVTVTVLRWVADRFIDPDIVSISLFTFDGFAFGAALAFAIHNNLYDRLRSILRLDVIAVAAGVILLVDLVLRDQWEGGGDPASAPYGYWYITYCALASTALIGHLYDRPDSLWAKLLSLPPIVFIGKLSYSLYLWHVPVQVYISRDRFPDWSLVQIIIVEQVLTFGIAYLSYRFIEMQAAKLRKRFVVKTAH
ncbi:MAG: acyltransferase [Actinomycetota bacterium]